MKAYGVWISTYLSDKAWHQHCVSNIIGHPMVMPEGHYEIATSWAFRLLYVAETFRVLSERSEKLRLFVSTNLSSQSFKNIWLFDWSIYIHSVSSSLIKIKIKRVITLYVKDGTCHRCVYKFRGHPYPVHQWPPPFPIFKLLLRSFLRREMRTIIYLETLIVLQYSTYM